MVYGQQQNWWRKKLNSLLNSLFAQQTSKMLRKSFPVAPTAASTKTTAVGAQNWRNIGTLPTNPAPHKTAKPTQKAKKKKEKRKKDATFRREAEASKIFPLSLPPSPQHHKDPTKTNLL